MDIEYNAKEENKKIVEEVSEKYGYSEELKKVLVKVLPAMLEGASYEEKELFFSMLRHTPIEIIPYESLTTSEDLKNKYFGRINPHIIEKKVDIGEYGKAPSDGALVSDVALKDDLEIDEIKQFIFIKELNPLDKKKQEFLGTSINVPHLIHELGHAWASEKNHFSIENNILTERTGTCKIKYRLTPIGNKKYEKEEIFREGIMTEEALNTNMENESLARYLGITLQELKEEYSVSGNLIPSTYQGLMSNITERLNQTKLKKDVRDWRLRDDENSLRKINEKMAETEEYKNRTKSNSDLARKIEIFENPESEKMAVFFRRCKSDFFPDKQNMTSMQIIDSVLKQTFDIKFNWDAFNLSEPRELNVYGDLVNSVVSDGYYLINQTDKILENSEKEVEQN